MLCMSRSCKVWGLCGGDQPGLLAGHDSAAVDGCRTYTVDHNDFFAEWIANNCIFALS